MPIKYFISIGHVVFGVEIKMLRQVGVIGPMPNF